MVKDYKEGLMRDAGVHNPTFWSAIVLVDIDDYVFGYQQYKDREKQFFLRKLYWTLNKEESKPYFILNGHRYYLDEFMRTGY